MAIRPILIAPDPRLKAVSAPVGTVDAATRRLIADMTESMYAAEGIGLAAIQIGEPKRIVVIDIDQREAKKNPRAFVDPVITWAAGVTGVFEEGCLSVPEIWEEVERASQIRLDYLDENGARQSLEAEGLLATCLQHELDHLQGILFIDHLSRLKRSMALKKLQKARRLKDAG